MSLTHQPTLVATGFDEEGALIDADGRLVAVLVRLADHNEVSPGAWYLEAGFGSGLEGPAHPTFGSLDQAKKWIAGRLASRAKPVAGAQS